jgi:heptosyltransferase-3
VVRGGAIGDFILTLPVFKALRETFPETSISTLAYPHVAELALRAGLLDDVRSIEARPLAGFFAKDGILDPKLCEYFAGFAIIISYLYDPDEIFRQNVARCSKAQYIQGLHRPDESKSIPASEVFLQALERLAVFGADPVPSLRLDPPFSVPLPEGEWIAVHPGSGSEKKNWPEENWAELLTGIQKNERFQLLLTGGEAEGERLERLARKLDRKRLIVALHRSLPHLAELLKQTSFYLGHDSGISHLAGALGLNGLLLWGETKASIWRPPHAGLQLLEAQPLSSLAVDTVALRVAEMLSIER